MPSWTTALLGKFLILAGIGSSSALIAGIPSAFTRQGERLWQLNSAFKDKLVKEGDWVVKEGNNKWLGANSRFQGIDLWKLGDVVYKKDRTTYKLALKDEWDQQSSSVDGKVTSKGALGLVKVSWKAGQGSETSSEVEISDSNKVWLIIAKGASAIYLMPVVRFSTDQESGSQDTSGAKKPWDASKEVWKKGVEDISQWTRDFDKLKEWESDANNLLKKLMGEGKEGFKIVQRIENIVLRGENGQNYQGKTQQFNKLFDDPNYKWINQAGFKSTQHLHLNAGILVDRDYSSSQWSQLSKYFPLDFVVLGDSSKVTYSSTIYGNEREIKIEDKITEVIGVRLDEVTIDSEGIGQGKDHRILWNPQFKPEISSILKK